MILWDGYRTVKISYHCNPKSDFCIAKRKRHWHTVYSSSLTCRFKEQEAAKQSFPGHYRDYSKKQRIGHCCVQEYTPWNSNDRSSTLHAGLSDKGGHSIKLDHVAWPHFPWYSEGPILKACRDGHVKVTRCSQHTAFLLSRCCGRLNASRYKSWNEKRETCKIRWCYFRGLWKQDQDV